MANLLGWLKNEANQVGNFVGGTVHGAEQNIQHYFAPPNRQQQQNTVNNINQAIGGSPLQQAQRAPTPPPPQYVNPVSALAQGINQHVVQPTVNYANKNYVQPVTRQIAGYTQVRSPQDFLHQLEQSSILQSLAPQDQIKLNQGPNKGSTITVPSLRGQVNLAGSFAGSGLKEKGPLDIAHQQTLKNGGATINLEGNQPTKGYAYAPNKGTETVIPTKDLTPQHFADFAKANADQLAQPGYHVGSWSNPADGMTYLDVSKVGPASAQTIAEAHGANQLAVHDLSNHNDIPIGQIGKNGVYSKLNEASSIHDNYQGQIAGAVRSGGVSGSPKIPQDIQSGTSKAPTPPQVQTTTGSLTPSEAKAVAKQLTTEPPPPKIATPTTGSKPLGVVKTIQNSPQTTPELSKGLTGSYNPLSNKAAMAAASQRIAADPGAARDFAVSTHSAEGNATAIQLAKQLESQGNHEAAANLMVTKSQQALQAGQGNQIYSMWDKLSPETVAQTAAKTIEKYNQTAKKPIPQLSAEQYKSFVDQANHIKTLPEGTRARGVATQNLLKQIGQLVPSSGGDKAFALYRTGLLTGFRTPGKILASHATSNTFEQAKNIPAKAADVAIGVARAPFIGKYQRGLSVTPRGNIAGGWHGTVAAVDNLFTGYDKPGTGGFPKDFANDTHFGNSWHGKIAQGYVNTVSRLHGSLYKPFYGAQHLNSLYDMATTVAKNQKLAGTERQSFISDFVKKATDYSTKHIEADPHADFSTPEGAALRANAEAKYTTFQNPTLLSRIASGAKRGSGNPTRYVAPFTQIPSSIAMKIVDYSPVGPIKEAIQQVHAGNFDQRALSQAIGRGTTGTGIMALGAALYNNGRITTAYPTDKKTQAQWQLEGKQANSVLVGGKWRQLSSLGPSGDAIAVGANYAEGMQGNKKTPGSLTNAGIQGATGGVETLATSPYLQTVENIGAALQSPGTKSQKVAEGLAGGLIPTGVANIASATDPLQRQTNSIKDTVTNKIPGLRENNLPKVDVFGNNVPRAQGAVGALLDPFYSTTAKSTPVVQELNRLMQSGNPATPDALTKNQTILGQKANLNPSQLTELTRQTGLPIGQQFQQLMNTPEYKNASDETKAKALNDIVSSIRDKGKVGFATGNTGGDNAASGTGLIDLNKASNSAKLTLAKDSFDASGKNYQVVGNTVLRRGADGTITATPKVKYDYQVGSATLISEKNAGNLSGYVKTAQSQLASISQQLQDPSIDPLEALTLQNQADTLQNNISKYSSYGGFTKGKAARAIKIPKFPTVKVAKFSQPKGVKVKSAAYKPYKPKKIAVSKMPKVV